MYVISGSSVSVIDVMVVDVQDSVPDASESTDEEVVTPDDAVMSVLVRVSVPLDVMENTGALQEEVSVTLTDSTVNNPVLTLASVFDPLIVSAGFVDDALLMVTVFVEAGSVLVDGE